MRGDLCPPGGLKPLKGSRRQRQRACRNRCRQPYSRRVQKTAQRCLDTGSGYYDGRTHPMASSPTTARAVKESRSVGGLGSNGATSKQARRSSHAAMIITMRMVRPEVPDRMPVSLRPDNTTNVWGKAGADYSSQPATDVLQRWPVSKRVKASMPATRMRP